MRKLNQLVFDNTIASATTNGVTTAPEFNDALGMYNQLSLQAVADLPSGTSPTLTVRIQMSADGINWTNKNGTAEINGVALTANAITASVGYDAGATPSLGLVRLLITLGGTTTQAHVKIWVTARDEG